MKKFWALALASIILLGALVACTGDPAATDTDGAPAETVNPEGDKIVLFEKGKHSDYNIFYPNDASAILQSSANGMAYRLSNYYGIDLYAFRENSSDGRNTEIYIGNADVDEVQTAIGLLKGVENEYLIKYFESGRLVLVGSNDKSVIQAVNDFIELYTKEDKLLIESDLEIYKDLGATERAGWKLSGVPEYTAGKLSTAAYNIGYGIACSSNSGRMQMAYDTTEAEFDAYIETLKASGFTVDSTNEVNGNKYVELLDSKKKVIYAYYVPSLGHVRVIADNNSCPESEFEYTYTPKEGEIAGIYQFAMMYDPISGGNGQGSEGKYPNNGAFHIIKLSDDSLVLIDGGGSTQATADATEALVDYLYQITGKEKGEKLTVACWYLTHAHGDHFFFARNLFRDYSDIIDLERVMHNLTMAEASGALQAMAKDIIAKYPNVKYIKPHQGQHIQLGDLTIDVLLTHETLTNPENAISYITDYNDTSDIIKFTINGVSMTYFGDWGGQWTIHDELGAMDTYRRNEKILLDMYRTEDGSYPMLKADILQVAHHAINDWLDNVYLAVYPSYAFIPQADVEFSKYQGGCFQAIIVELANMKVPNDHIFHANRLTHWLEIAQDGTITHKCQPLTGADEGYYYYVDANGNVLYEDEDGKINTEKKGTMIKDADGKATFEGMTDIKAVYEKGYWDYVNVHKPFNPNFFSPEEV